MNVETLTTLTGIDRVNAIAAHVESLPQDLRGPTTRAYQRRLPTWESARLKYNWNLHARESQLPPDGDWDTWLILAGRGFGKTRTGAEWIRSQVEDKKARRIALVARTTDEAQSVMIEGESGILNICPHWNMPTYEPSKRKLTWPNGAFALVFSSHEPDQLRGPSVRRRLVRRAFIMAVPQTRHGTTSHSPCASDDTRAPSSPQHPRLSS